MSRPVRLTQVGGVKPAPVRACQWHRGCTKRAGWRGYCHPHYHTMCAAGLLHAELVDAAPVRARIEEHLQRGRTICSLQDVSGADHHTLERILAGETSRVRTRTAAKIMAVPLRPSHIGCARRVRAWCRHGYTIPAICATTGISLKAMRYALRRGHFFDHQAERIAAAYDQVRTDRPGPSPVARSMAAAKGWHPILAWDGADIDDPAAIPDLGAEEPVTAEYLRGEMAHLTSLGVLPEFAARRLGIEGPELTRQDRDCALCGHRFMASHGRQAHCDACRPKAKVARKRRYRASLRAEGTSQDREVAA